MAPSPARGSTAQFKIARGTLIDFRSVILKLLLGIALWIGGFVAAVMTFGPAMKGFLALGPVGLLAMVVALIVYLNLPGRLSLGTDGLLVDWRGDRRYVPYSSLEDAPPYAEDVLGKRMIGVELALRGGTTLKVPIGEDQFGADQRVRELSGAIRAALADYRRLEAADDGAILARGERSTEAWVARLRGLGQGANAGPREAPIPAERLWRIVEDPRAKASERAGAAVALTGGLDEPGKQRLRLAAESTVAPQLRITLEAAATGDEEAVSEALAQVERGAED